MSGGIDDLIINDAGLTAANSALAAAKQLFDEGKSEINAAMQLKWSDQSGQEFHDQVTQFDKELQKVEERLNSNIEALRKITTIALNAAAELKAKSAGIYGN